VVVFVAASDVGAGVGFVVASASAFVAKVPASNSLLLLMG